jgi:hypothetical protein
MPSSDLLHARAGFLCLRDNPQLGLGSQDLNTSF